MQSQKIVSLNPGKNYEIIGEISISSTAEIDKKVAKARAAQQSWAGLDFKKRIEFLENLYSEFVKNKNEIGSLATREMGMPALVRTIDLDIGLQYMRGYLDFAETWLAPETVFENDKEMHYLFFEPRGVIGISIPWNYPFCNFVWGVIQNLVVGNTVVCKHSEECPLTGKLLEDIILSTKLPDGVFNEIYGEGHGVGNYLMNSAIDGIHFTGSTRAGQHLYQVAAKKFIPAILELGGSAPGIVFDDADLSIAIESIYFNRFVNSGQTCDGLKRLIVHRSYFDQVVGQLKNLLMTKKIGNPEDPATDIGPLVAERQCIVAEEQVADALSKGASLITGGKRPDGLLGAYYEPTILTNIGFDMRVWKEEVFAPVLPIVSFESDDEAVALANDTSYGLGAYLYTKNKERALRIGKLIKSGDISVNATNYCIVQDPFGGYKNSGIGREHGKHGLRELCSLKIIALKK
jgi:acyl-CoA reductase-like NAD-dependent aldehyde dehydrogenase